METKQFAELLKNPLLVEQLPVEGLRELVRQYPFSPSLQMLLLKHYQLNEHPAYDEQLAKAAIHAPERRALYRLVQLKPIAGAVAPAFETAEAEIETAVLETPETIEPETAAEETPAPVELKPSNAYTNWNLPQDEEPTDNIPTETLESEELVDTVVPEIEALPEEVQRELLEPEPDSLETAPMLEEMMGALLEYDLSDRIILHETHEEDIDEEELETQPEEASEEVAKVEEAKVGEEQEVKEVLEEDEAIDEPEPIAEEETEAELDVEEDDTSATDIKPDHTHVSDKETKNEVPDSQPVTNVTLSGAEVRNSQPVTSSKDSFLGWLKRVNRHEAPVGAEPDDELDAIYVASNYEASLLKDASELPIKPFVDPTAKHTKEDLMEPDEEANKRMDEQAKKSMTMGDELVTETLAKIYEIQKKTTKAIEAYEVLKVRFPEKADKYNQKIQSLREI